MKHSIRIQRRLFSRELWVDAFKGPGLGAGLGATLGFILEFALGLPERGAGGELVLGFSFLGLPGVGAAIGGALGALWMQTRPSMKRLQESHQEKESS